MSSKKLLIEVAHRIQMTNQSIITSHNEVIIQQNNRLD